jgi:hypothetical protein
MDIGRQRHRSSELLSVHKLTIRQRPSQHCRLHDVQWRSAPAPAPSVAVEVYLWIPSVGRPRDDLAVRLLACLLSVYYDFDSFSRELNSGGFKRDRRRGTWVPLFIAAVVVSLTSAAGGSDGTRAVRGA